jgi:phosphoheptose isomerase
LWNNDDTKLVSCGMDGAVYEWDAISGRRTGEFVLKNCSYTSVGLSVDARNIFAVGSDRKLKEISDSQVCLHYLFNYKINKNNLTYDYKKRYYVKLK